MAVRIIGHMGMGKLGSGGPYAENSIPGFLAALEAGADGIEFDLHLSSDDEIVIHHDYRLGRTADEEQVGDKHHLIEHLPAEELTKVVLRGSPEATIPTLREVLDAVGPVLGEGELWVELKPQVPRSRGRHLVEKALDMLTAEPVWPQVILRSFDHGLLVEAIQRRPDARTHALTVTRVHHALEQGKAHGFEGVAIAHQLAHEKHCDLVHDAGLTVTAGGEPNEAETERIMKQAAERGDIDYICTDHVAAALAKRAET